MQFYHECQIRNTIKVAILFTISTPVTIFSQVHIDIMFMLTGTWLVNATESSEECKYIVAAKDDLSEAAK